MHLNNNNLDDLFKSILIILFLSSLFRFAGIEKRKTKGKLFLNQEQLKQASINLSALKFR